MGVGEMGVGEMALTHLSMPFLLAHEPLSFQLSAIMTLAARLLQFAVKDNNT